MAKPLILLADDEPHITHILAQKLKRAGMEVMVVDDGKLALSFALEHHPDAIITDLQMPYLSGIELAEQLAQHKECASIPIIMLTARGYAVQDQVKCLSSIRKLYSKPFSAKELLGFLMTILDEDQYAQGKCA